MLIWTSTGDKGMNRFQRGENGPLMEDGGELSSFLNATTGSTYPAVIRGNLSKDSRKYVLKGSKTQDSEASPFALCCINPEEICAVIGRRREAQGRPGEALEMNSAPGQALSNVHTADITASCAKGKEERKGKNLLRGWKRDATVRARKEKHSDGRTSPVVFSPILPEHLPTVTNRETQSHRADGGMVDVGKNGLDGGIKGSAIVVRRHDDTATPSKKQRTEKVEPMFTVPAPPTQGHPGPPGPLPLAPNTSPAMPLSPKQVLVRTRSVGTNTQDGVVLGGHEVDGACLGPCQPGTSVNLEGIVWHETEEGVLVVNVTWRKRTYVGTLLDCTKHDWAPPRFCESPSSDPEMPGGRGRGKRMRLAIPERPCTDPGPPKVRGLSQHRSRGGGVAGVGGGPIHTKGRRGSLNLINSNCRTPPFFTVDEVKTPNSTSLSSGKRKNKPPADLDLTLVADDGKNGNGKRIRAKSRSAPSTPQGKSDPTFLDSSGCATTTSPPILIDCPHPNCTKKYKHINGLRYHQTHAHLEAEERKPEMETETEDRLSDCEETLSNTAFELSETTSNSCSVSSKKPGPMYKVTTVGSPKNRRLLLSTDHSPLANAKTRRHSLLKEGLIDDLSNLPIISNMTVVLENCMVTDRNSTVEMPKLEAEGLIDKKSICDKGKKANGKVEKCLNKSRTNRPIAPAPAPPKLIAIPNTPYPTSTNAADSAPQQPSPIPSVGLTTKNLPLKPIKPKLSIVVEPGLTKTTIVTCKEPRKKEKRRLKDKHNKDAKTRTPNGENINIQLKLEDVNTKMPPREPSGSLLKEHLSKHDGVNGLTETQESRMASIRAEADKVYTFTDNAPSPSIGSSSRLDASSLTSGDGGSSKNNSPAYSDISDAGDDGGLSDCRSEARSKSSSVTSEVTSNNNHGNPASKTPPSAPTGPPVVKDSQSPFYHGYDPYYLQGYVQSGQTFHKSSSSHESKVKREDAKEEEKVGHEKTEVSQSQLHLAMSQTQTALAQSLYYGQYARGLYMDQKLLMASKCCDQQQTSGKQRGDRAPTAIRDIEEVKHIVTSSGGMIKDSGKSCCPKPGLSYVEMGERGQNLSTQHGGKGTYGSSMDHQHKDCDDMKSQSSLNSNNPTDPDSNVSFSNPPDIQTWARLNQPKYVEQNHGEESEDVDLERAKDWDSGPEVGTNMGGGGAGDLKKVKNLELPSTMDDEDCDGLERMDQEQEQEPMGSEDSQNARAAVSPPMTPQQPYIQYQHSYPYLQMCETGNGSYRGVSPTLTHSYPGFHYPLYGKTAGREESDVTQSGRSSSSKQSSEAIAMELLQQQSLQYHGKSPAAGEKGSPEGEREVERERNHVAFARHLHTHHHTHMGMTYPLMTGQYDLYQENEGKK